jgi:hypothetical protein
MRALLAIAARVLPLGLALAAGPLLAQEVSPEPPPRISVVTVGPGDAVWERFGHNYIWVQDPARGIDLAYNYGMFDFGQENFFANFARGRMMYWMAALDPYLSLEHYSGQNRTIWIQELDLTAEQATALRDFLVWNERPENRNYRYDYYRDNCSTRVRDALDRAATGDSACRFRRDVPVAHLPADRSGRDGRPGLFRNRRWARPRRGSAHRSVGGDVPSDEGP